MRYIFCDECDTSFEMIEASHDHIGWATKCPHCGHENPIDVDAFVVPVGTKVILNGGSPGIIRSNDAKKANSFTDIYYLIEYKCGGEWRTIRSKRTGFNIHEDWRLLARDEYGIRRVCHYPKNQEYYSAPCFGCSDRAKCNNDIFDRLIQYEEQDEAIRETGHTFDQLGRIAEGILDGTVIKLPCPINGQLWRVKPTTAGTWFVTPTTLNQNTLYRIVFGGEYGKVVFDTKDQALRRAEELNSGRRSEAKE